MQHKNKKWIKWLIYVIGIIIIYLIFTIRVKLLSILNPFILAIVLAYLLNPIVNFVENKGVKRILSVLIVYLLFIAIIVTLGWTIIPSIVDETSKLISDLPEYANQVQDFIKDFRESNQTRLPNSVNQIINDNVDKIETVAINSLKRISSFVIDFFSQFLNLILVPIIAFYFLKDKDKFKRGMISLIPQRWREEILDVSSDIDDAIGNFIRGQIIVALFVGGLSALGLYILKIKYALVIGVIAGLTNVIPYFGPFIGALPALIVALIQSPSKVLWVAGLFTIIQQTEGGIISPNIIGSTVGLHPVAIILSLLVGGSFFGIIGMILAVPVAATIKVIFKHIVKRITT